MQYLANSSKQSVGAGKDRLFGNDDVTGGRESKENLVRGKKVLTSGGGTGSNILYGNYGEDKGDYSVKSGVPTNNRVVMMSHVPISNISNG